MPGLTGHLPLVMARQDPSNFKSKSPRTCFFLSTASQAFHKRRTASALRFQARSNVLRTAPRAQKTAHPAQTPVFPAPPPRIKFRQRSKAQTESSRVREPGAHAEKSRCASAPTRAAPPSRASPPQPFSKDRLRSRLIFSTYL